MSGLRPGVPYGDDPPELAAEEDAGPVFACTVCTWHSIPGDYPEAGACPRCGECVTPCEC